MGPDSRSLLLLLAAGVPSQRAASDFSLPFSANAGHAISRDISTSDGEPPPERTSGEIRIVVTSPPVNHTLPGIVRTLTFAVELYDRHGQKLAPDGLARPSIRVSESPPIGEIPARVFALDGGAAFGAWFHVPHTPNIPPEATYPAPKKRPITISLTAEHPRYAIGATDLTVVVRESMGDSMIVQQEEASKSSLKKNESPQTVPGDVVYDIGSISPEPCYFAVGRSVPLRHSTLVYCIQPGTAVSGDHRGHYEKSHAFNLRQVSCAISDKTGLPIKFIYKVIPTGMDGDMREYNTFTCSIDGLLQRRVVQPATILRISSCGFVINSGGNSTEALSAALRGMAMLLAHKQAPRLVYFLQTTGPTGRFGEAPEHLAAVCAVTDAVREDHARVVHSALIRAGYALMSELDIASMPLPALKLGPDMRPTVPTSVYVKIRRAEAGEILDFPHIASGARYPGDESPATYLRFCGPDDSPYPAMMVPGSGYEINTRLNCSTLVDESVAVIMPGFVKQASKDHGQKIVWLPPNYATSLQMEYTIMVSLANTDLLRDEPSAPAMDPQAPIVVYETFLTKLVALEDFNNEIDSLTRCAVVSGDGLQTAVADGKTPSSFTIRLIERGDDVPDGYFGCPKLQPCQAVFSIRLEGPSLVAPDVNCDPEGNGNMYRVSYTLAEAGSYDLQVSAIRLKFMDDRDRLYSSGDQVEAFIIPPTTVEASDGDFQQPLRTCSAREAGAVPGRWVMQSVAEERNWSGYFSDDDQYVWIPFTCLLRNYHEHHVQRCADQHRRQRGHPLHLILMGNSQLLSTWMDLHAELARTKAERAPGARSTNGSRVDGPAAGSNVERHSSEAENLVLDMYPTMKDGTWRVKVRLPHCQSPCETFRIWYRNMFHQLQHFAHNSTYLVTNFAVAVPDAAECLRDHVLPYWQNFTGSLILRLSEKVHVQNAPDSWRFRRKALADAQVLLRQRVCYL
jgi:hypothetical protein